MAGTNLEAQGLYIPRPLTPGRSPLIRPHRFLSLQCHHESSTISDEPPQEILTAGDISRRNSLLKHFPVESSFQRHEPRITFPSPFRG
jgi:hypothetical protein